MLTYVKKSKLDKVSKIFTIVKISMEKEDKNEVSLPYLIPPSEILIPVRQGSISKKKFNKKYLKYLKNSKSAEFAIFNLLKAIKNKSSLCFTCTDDEFNLGYVKTLLEYLNEEYDINFYSYKEASELLKDELSSLDKKHRKLLKLSDDEIPDNKKKLYNKITNNVKKLIKSSFSEEANEKFDALDKKFAVEQIIWTSIDKGICSYNKNTIVNIDESKISKTKPYVMAIMLTANSDKFYKNIVKSVLSANSLKLKEKQLKKLSKVQIVSLCGEIVKKISEIRENEEL